MKSNLLNVFILKTSFLYVHEYEMEFFLSIHYFDQKETHVRPHSEKFSFDFQSSGIPRSSTVIFSHPLNLNGS